MRTIIAISLLVLLAAVACGEETPELVATAEPTVGSTQSATGAPAIPTPTVTVAATPSPTDTPEPSPTTTTDSTNATPTPTATPEPTPEPQPTSTATPEPTATPQTQTFNVGDTVQLGNLHVTVNGTRGSRGDDFWAPDEGNYFVYVDVTFRNDGDESERGYVNRCVNDIRRRPSQPLIQWRFHPHTVHRDRRLRSTQGPSDA